MATQTLGSLSTNLIVPLTIGYFHWSIPKFFRLWTMEWKEALYCLSGFTPILALKFRNIPSLRHCSSWFNYFVAPILPVLMCGLHEPVVATRFSIQSSIHQSLCISCGELLWPSENPPYCYEQIPSLYCFRSRSIAIFIITEALGSNHV